MPPLTAVGTVASRRARTPTRPVPLVQRATSRSKSPGTADIARNSTITLAPKIAGMTVIANGAGPGQIPRYSPKPSITRVAM